MELAILILATWRLSSLLAYESGPFDIFSGLRSVFGVEYDQDARPIATNGLSEMILCSWCNSVWVGAILTTVYITVSDWTLALALPLALSSGAIIVDETIGRIKA